MSNNKYAVDEKEINSVLKYQDELLKTIEHPDMSVADERIAESEKLLTSLGYSLVNTPQLQLEESKKKVMVVPSWEELVNDAESVVGNNVEIEDLFTEEELKSNSQAIRMLNDEYNTLHKLDKFDVLICVSAGILGAIVDILLVGIPKKTHEGLKGGPLSNYVRDWFEKKYPEDEMNKLASQKISKVPYDAQDNRHIKEEDRVEGLSAYYHRLLSLGHDPLLGFFIGVWDIMHGTMTTIDKKGKVANQIMENYAERKESNVFAAIAKQIIHLKSDITTSMGLPVPLMGLFNLLQFGSIGEEDQTIAEIVQGMYFEGYDFIHFCSMSIPVMIIEVVVRLGYAIKRIKEGHSIKESIPVILNRKNHPKLPTMLFIGHSVSTAVNAGKILFTKNPMAINYPQWISFARYSYKQLKWVLFRKPRLRDAYVRGEITEKLQEVYDEIDNTFEEFSDDYIMVINN